MRRAHLPLSRRGRGPYDVGANEQAEKPQVHPVKPYVRVLHSTNGHLRFAHSLGLSTYKCPARRRGHDFCERRRPTALHYQPHLRPEDRAGDASTCRLVQGFPLRLRRSLRPYRRDASDHHQCHSSVRLHSQCKHSSYCERSPVDCNHLHLVHRIPPDSDGHSWVDTTSEDAVGEVRIWTVENESRISARSDSYPYFRSRLPLRNGVESTTTTEQPRLVRCQMVLLFFRLRNRDLCDLPVSHRTSRPQISHPGWE